MVCVVSTKTANIYPTLPAQPDAEMIERYREDGYLAFLNVLTPEEVKAATANIFLMMMAARQELLKEGIAEPTNEQIQERMLKTASTKGMN